MLSLARSRYTNVARLVFMAANIVGLVFGITYKNKTPDLYPGSTHSAVGWIATGIAATQISQLLIFPLEKLFNRFTGRCEIENTKYMLYPIRTNLQNLQGHDDASGVSRQGSFEVGDTHVYVEDHETSSDSHLHPEELRESGCTSEADTFVGDPDSIQVLHQNPIAAIAHIFSEPSCSWTQKIVLPIYNILDRIVLIVAFIAICTGIVAFWGLFVSLIAP
jgi:hypothetical protein